MVNPYFNLIVPTKNRADTLFWVIKTLLVQDYSNYQIIISDNFSEDNTKAVVDSFTSDKIVYINTGKRLSMSSNYEFALSHVEKGYVMIIGDDDALIPNTLKTLADLITTHKPDAFISKKFAYYWPNYSISSLQNILIEPSLRKNCYWLRSEEILNYSSNWLYVTNLVDYGSSILPMLYHGGCISNDLIKTIIKKDGKFYNSQFPDYYSGFRVAAEVDKYLYIENPYFIGGSSGKSTGLSAFLNENQKNSEFSQFQIDNDIPLAEPLVFCHSFTLFAMETILNASRFSSKIKLFDWKTALRKMIDDGYHKTTIEQHNSVISTALLISKKVNLESFAQQLIAGRTFEEKRLERKADFFDKKNNTFVRDVSKIQIQNIYEAALFINENNSFTKPKLIRNTKRYFLKMRFRNLMVRILVKLKLL